MPFDMLEEARLKLESIPEIVVVHLYPKKDEFDAYYKKYQEMYQNHDAFLDKLGDKLYAHHVIDNWKKEKQVITKMNILPNIVYLH